VRSQPLRLALATALTVIVACVGLLTPAAAVATVEPSALTAGQVLGSEQRIVSPDGSYRFVMQSDGNAVLYGPTKAIWSTRTFGSGYHLTMGADGVLVVATPADAPVWSSGTSGATGARLAIQDDGNLVIYSTAEKALWAVSRLLAPVAPAPATKSTLKMGEQLLSGQLLQTPDLARRFLMQSDGNAVVYGPSVRWATRTSGAGNRLTLQSDGNLVLYTKAGRVLWNAKTGGRQGTRLTIEKDANLVIYRADNKAVWSWMTGLLVTSAAAPTPTPTPTPSLFAYGHSYVEGAGASDSAHNFVALLGARRGALTDNNGKSGAVMGQVVAIASNTAEKTWTPGSHGLVVLDAVLNSVINVPSSADATEKVDFPNSLRTLLRLFRSHRWAPETDASAVKTSKWTTVPVPIAGNGSAIKTIVPGEKVTITTSASEISLMLIGFKPSLGAGSPFSVTVNGVPRGSGTTVGQTTDETPFHDVSYRVGGLTGTSTIVLTKGAGAGELYFDGYLDRSATPPAVVVVKDPTPTPAGLAINGLDVNRTAGNLAIFNGMVDSVVAEPEFAGAVKVANPGAIWNTATMYASDHVHPNDLGHSVIADTIQGVAG